MRSEDNCLDFVDAGCSHEDFRLPPENQAEPTLSHIVRSDVLRHALPRPRHIPIPFIHNVAARATKQPDRKSISRAANRHTRRRVTFHKVLTSLFNASPAEDESPADPSVVPTSSTVRSRANSGSFAGSIPSLEFVSTGAFIFSSPSLKSLSRSLSTCASRFSALTSNSGDLISLHHAQSEASVLNRMLTPEDGILEPWIDNSIVRTMSDILMTTHRTDKPLRLIPDTSNIEKTVPMNDDELFYNKALLRTPSSSLCFVLLPYLDDDSRRALRSTCRAWHDTLHTSPPNLPPAHRVPNEIIQHIYQYLGPRDFNAARHTCQTWMHASLDEKLLCTMLRRGGWLDSAKVDLATLSEQRDSSMSKGTTRQWLLSCRLARECCLSSNWTGSGLSGSDDKYPVVFSEASHTDFNDFAGAHSGSAERGHGGLLYIASVCGKFLLVSRGTVINIYHLRDGSLAPETRIICPRRVVSMSMDASSGRNAVAALLEGRMGMVCELQYQRQSSLEPSEETDVNSEHQCGSDKTIRGISAQHSPETSSQIEAETSLRTSSLDANPKPCIALIESVDVQSGDQAISLQEVHDRRCFSQNCINQTWNLEIQGPRRDALTEGRTFDSRDFCSLPVESGKCTFYRHLCSEDDPPRSVTICPQRRCVAFGCSASIELHWVDALTGQSLGRWFPLTTPSDCLFFLAPRPGFESAKKLRLISSAAHPRHRPGLSRKSCSNQFILGSLWDSFSLESRCVRGSFIVDHFRAVPLSDGYHVLFIDPRTDALFLGSDAPLGGPTKLFRKIMFVPPDSQRQAPRLYTAAFDNSGVARIAAVYDEKLVLYSVPSDVCNTSRLEANSWDVYDKTPSWDRPHNRDHWLNWWDGPEPVDCPNISPLWPIAIRGTEVGTLEGLCELAIQTSPDITIWGFTLDSQCKTWRLRQYVDPSELSYGYVCDNGNVHYVSSLETSSICNTTAAEFSPPTSASSSRVQSPTMSPLVSRNHSPCDSDRWDGFDGHASQILRPPEHSDTLQLVKRIPGALAVENDEWVEFLDVRGCNAWYEENGDVLMVPWDSHVGGMELEAEIEVLGR